MLIPASSSVCGLITRRPSRGGCVTQPPINLTDVRFQHDTEYFHASSRLCGFLFNRSMWQKHLGMQESFIDNRAVAALTKTHSLTDLQWDSWCGVWFLVLCKQAGATSFHRQKWLNIQIRVGGDKEPVHSPLFERQSSGSSAKIFTRETRRWHIPAPCSLVRML